MVLDRHVLLAAEAPAHQAVADLYLLRRQAQHAHGLVLGVIGALVRGEDHDPVSVGIGHGALRLQEGVLRPGGGEVLGQHMLRLGDGLRRVAPLDVLVGQQIPGPVDQGGVGQHGLPGAADHGQLLIVHLHQRLGLGQDLRRLRRHQADGVPQVVGDVPHGDHGVPVLHQMAHLVLPGDVVRRKDAHHAGQGPGLLRVDGQHPGPGILGPDGAAVDHAVQIDVVGIDAGAGDLLLHVHPGHPLAQGPVGGERRHLALAEQLCRQQDAVDDLHIPGAAADVVADGVGRLLPGGIWIRVQQSLGAHHHAGDAEAALDRPRHAEGVGVDLLFKIAQSLHRDDGLALQLVGLGDAGLGGLAVDQHRAGAAGALAAAVLHAGEMQGIPQIAQQLLVLFHCHGLAVHGKMCHGLILLDCRAQALVPRSSAFSRKGRPFLFALLYNIFPAAATGHWRMRYFISETTPVGGSSHPTSRAPCRTVIRAFGAMM